MDAYVGSASFIYRIVHVRVNIYFAENWLFYAEDHLYYITVFD